MEKLCDTGEIRIGNYHGYKKVENTAIKDHNEGHRFLTRFDNPADLKVRMKVEGGEFIDLPADHVPPVTITESSLSQIATYSDTYIFCASLSDKINLFEGYDCCYQIKSLQFFQLIGKALYEKGLLASTHVEYGDIEYFQDALVDYKNPIHGIWVKDDKFKYDEEFRFVFHAKLKEPKEILSPVDLIIPGIKNHIKIIR